jgi:hypothetical protein
VPGVVVAVVVVVVGDITTVVVVFWVLHPARTDISKIKISRDDNRFNICFTPLLQVQYIICSQSA